MRHSPGGMNARTGDLKGPAAEGLPPTPKPAASRLAIVGGVLAVCTIVGSVVAFATTNSVALSTEPDLDAVSLVVDDGSRITLEEALNDGPVLVVHGPLPDQAGPLADRLGVKKIVLLTEDRPAELIRVPILLDRAHRLSQVLDLPNGSAILMDDTGRRSRPMSLAALRELA